MLRTSFEFCPPDLEIRHSLQSKLKLLEREVEATCEVCKALEKKLNAVERRRHQSFESVFVTYDPVSGQEDIFKALQEIAHKVAFSAKVRVQVAADKRHADLSTTAQQSKVEEQERMQQRSEKLQVVAATMSEPKQEANGGGLGHHDGDLSAGQKDVGDSHQVADPGAVQERVVGGRMEGTLGQGSDSVEVGVESSHEDLQKEAPEVTGH